MLTQLSIIIALAVILATGSFANTGTTNTNAKGINPVQHSE